MRRERGPDLRQAETGDGDWPDAGSESAQLRESRKRIRLLEEENEVLRRAAAYLSQAHLPGKALPARGRAGRRRDPRDVVPVDAALAHVVNVDRAVRSTVPRVFACMHARGYDASIEAIEAIMAHVDRSGPVTSGETAEARAYVDCRESSGLIAAMVAAATSSENSLLLIHRDERPGILAANRKLMDLVDRIIVSGGIGESCSATGMSC